MTALWRRHVLIPFVVCATAFVLSCVSATAFDVSPTVAKDGLMVSDEDRYRAYQVGRTGTELYKAGQYEAACEKFKEALQLDPAETNSRINMTMSLFRLGKTAEGLACLDQARPPADNNPTYWFNVGVTYGMLGSFSNALKNLNYFIEHFPDDSRIKEAVGLVQSFTGASAGTPLKSDGADEKDNYFNIACKDGATRWADNSMPLKVHISGERKLKGFNPEFVQVVKSAFDEWSTASGGVVSFEYTGSSKNAGINVAWTESPGDLPNPVESGHCKVSGNEKGTSVADIILLIVNRSDGSVVSTAKLKYTASHEIGHALGIAGHSPDARDVMFLGAIDNNFPDKISVRDIETLKRIYSTPTDKLFAISAQNAWVAAANKGVAELNSGKPDGAASLFEEALRLTPEDKRNYVKGLLGLAFYNKALLLIRKREMDAARELLNKSCELLQVAEDKKGLNKARQAYKLLDASPPDPSRPASFQLSR
ncbi:MAG: tetratricopeptide repeat protein [Candidatus Obscuribacterales bacterium]|nr:tetratricopeptide repeat protein [Candidatus Obscuribacterales bacterium]